MIKLKLVVYFYVILPSPLVCHTGFILLGLAITQSALHFTVVSETSCMALNGLVEMLIV